MGSGFEVNLSQWENLKRKIHEEPWEERCLPLLLLSFLSSPLLSFPLLPFPPFRYSPSCLQPVAIILLVYRQKPLPTQKVCSHFVCVHICSRCLSVWHEQQRFDWLQAVLDGDINTLTIDRLGTPQDPWWIRLQQQRVGLRALQEQFSSQVIFLVRIKIVQLGLKAATSAAKPNK